MRKSVVLPLLGIAVIAAAGGGYAAIKYRHDPLRDGRALMAKGDLRGASIELRTAVRDDPDNRDAHFALAQLHTRTGDPIAAEKELRAAIQHGYDRQKVNPMLAQAYLDQQKFKELLAEFPVPQGAPDNVAPILIARGLAMFALKNAAGAQQSISQAEQIAPDDADAAFAAARLALANRDLPLAEQKIDRTLAISPHVAQARLLKAQVMLARNDRPGALEQLGTAITDSPHYDAARLERANLLLTIGGEDARAKADVDAVLADAPKNPTAIYFDGVLRVRQKDFTGANADFQQISSVLNRFPRALFFDAIVKASLGQMAQATDSATRYVAQAPGDLDGAKLLARIYLGNRRPDLAIGVLNKTADAGRSDSELLDLLGRAYAMAGNGAEALRSYTQASQLAPNSADILTRLASTRLGMGDAGGASADLQKSLALAPDQPAVSEALVVTAMSSGDLPKAKAALEKLHGTQGDTEVVGNLAGLVKVAELDLVGAQTQFEKVLTAFPNSVPAKLNRAKVLGMQGRRADAEASLAELIERQPANEPAVLALVAAMLEDNQLPRAVDILQKAHAAAPDNAGFIASLSDLLIRAKQGSQAMLLLDEAAKNQASVPLLMGARARAQVAIDRPKDAIDSYRKILAANPNDLDARTRLVDLTMGAGDFESAKSVLRDGLRVFPGNLSIMEAIVRADMREAGIDSGLAAADQLASDPANLPVARVLKGDLYASARRFDEAAAAYAAELKANPSSLLAVRLAIGLNLAGKPDQAIGALRDWIARNPGDIDALLPLSTFDLSAKHYDEAKTELEAILKTRPNDAASMNNLAWIYQRLGDPRALGLAERAYLLAPTADTADTYGWVLATQGQSDKAVILLRSAAFRRPPNGTILYHYGVALKDTGQRDEAIRDLTSAVSLPGEFDEREPAKKLLADLSTQH